MSTMIKTWGNSQGIRLPLHILEQSLFKINDEVEVVAKENKIIITKPIKKHKTLAERLEFFEDDYEYEEWDTGKPVGSEVW